MAITTCSVTAPSLIISTPETPRRDNQSLYVRLAKSGPLVLSGDLYHYPLRAHAEGFPAFGPQAAGNDAQKQHREGQSRSAAEG